MIYIVTALLAEAKAIIETLQLKRQSSKPFEIYSTDNYTLVISGMGYDNALMATTHLLTRFPPQAQDMLINIGIAGAQSSFTLGEGLIAHTLFDHATEKTFFPDMRMTHPFKECALTTFFTPQGLDQGFEAVDMEATAVFKAALLYLSTAQIVIFKVVSDHFSTQIPTKDAVYGWIKPHTALLFESINYACGKLPQKVSFSALLVAEQDKIIQALQLTKAQTDQFNDALKGYILRHHKEPLLPKPLPTLHKKEQKDAFNKLLTLLAS